jgi:hypothetical protein
MFDAVIDTDARVLDQLPPGPALAQLLATIDLEAISGDDRVAVLRAHQRMASHYAARVYGDIAAISDAISDLDDDPALAHEAAAAEIRAALRLTRRAADIELGLALDLRRRLPAVYRLLHSGQLDVRRARAIADATSHLTVAAAQSVVEEIIGEAPNLTTGQLTAKIRRVSIDHDPDHARDRYQHATEQRRLVTEPTVDGTAHLLGLDLPPEKVQEVTNRINRLAKLLRRDGETRSMDQLRADVYLDLLTGTARGRGGTVDIRVDLTTLAELSEASGELGGYGPVIADIARQVTGQATEWRFTVTDPETGAPAMNGTTRRRPTKDQQRTVELRNPTCIFPGCRMPATDCDLDHTTPYAEGGLTEEHNLAPLCRHDHRIKDTGWTYQPLPNGDHRWTSKLGHTYTTSGRSP